MRFSFLLDFFILSQAQKTDLRAENLKLQKTNRALNQALRSLNAKNEAKVGASMEPKHPGECTDAELAAGCRYYKNMVTGAAAPLPKKKR
eukprot:UN27851